MPVHNIDEVKAEALEKLRQEDYKVAVENEKSRLRKLKGTLFTKRLVFQWPIRFDVKHRPLNRRRTDKGRVK